MSLAQELDAHADRHRRGKSKWARLAPPWGLPSGLPPQYQPGPAPLVDEGVFAQLCSIRLEWCLVGRSHSRLQAMLWLWFVLQTQLCIITGLSAQYVTRPARRFDRADYRVRGPKSECRDCPQPHRQSNQHFQHMQTTTQRHAETVQSCSNSQNNTSKTCSMK